MLRVHQHCQKRALFPQFVGWWSFSTGRSLSVAEPLVSQKQQLERTDVSLQKDFSQEGKQPKTWDSSCGGSGQKSKLNEFICVDSHRPPASQARHEYDFEALAPLANGSCFLTSGNTQILATVIVADRHEHIYRRQLFKSPLQVEHRERWGATGRVPYGFQGREGGTDKERQVAAMIGQALRPMLPSTWRQAIDVTTATLSDDRACNTLELAINAASLALARSRLPLVQQVAATTYSHPSASDTNLLLAGSKDGVVMVTAQGGLLSEEIFGEGLSSAYANLQETLRNQEYVMPHPSGCDDRELPGIIDSAAMAQITDHGKQLAMYALQDDSEPSHTLTTRLYNAKALLQATLQSRGFIRTEGMRVAGSGCVSPLDLDLGWAALVDSCVAEMAVQNNERVAGRGLLNNRVASFKQTPLHVPHGSALCSLGNTQVLSYTAVASAGRKDNDLLPSSNLTVVSSSLSSPKEQVNLASDFVEAALLPVLPSEQQFPFALRVNCEACSLDGSIAEASVCSTSLALADAGVPLQSLVAGVGVGFMNGSAAKAEHSSTASPGTKVWEYLIDPQGIEESACSALLCTAGTKDALTALSLTSSTAVPLDVVLEAIQKAKPVRQRLLSDIQSSIEQGPGRGQARFGQADVPKEEMRRLIGPGGTTLRAIEESSGAKICVNDNDAVYVYAATEAGFKRCNDAIAEITGRGIKVGQRMLVRVVKIMDFGAFVEMPNGLQALLHVSELEKRRVQRVDDVLELGQELQVVCLGKDRKGQLKLSRKALL